MEPCKYLEKQSNLVEERPIKADEGRISQVVYNLVDGTKIKQYKHE